MPIIPLLALALANPASAVDRDLGALRAEIRGLHRQLAQLHDDAHAPGFDPTLALDVISDASTRTSLRDAPFTAGWDDRFVIRDDAGDFELRLQGVVQTRYIAARRDESDDRWRSGFDVRRARLDFRGHIWRPELTYHVHVSGRTTNGDLRLNNGWIGYAIPDTDVRLRFGQVKLPFTREQLIPVRFSTGLERSVVNAVYNLGRSRGIEARWRGDDLQLQAMISSGADRLNEDALTADAEYAVTGRIEWRIVGAWRQFRDLPSWTSDETGVLIGAAAHVERTEVGAGLTREDRFTATLDTQLEFGVGHAHAALIIDDRDGDAGDVTRWGAVAQGGVWLAPDTWEMFGRVEWSDFSDDADDLLLVTIGLNRYWAKHQLKWNTDVGYAINEVRGLSDSVTRSTGWSDSGAGEIVVRTSLQLLF